MTFKGDQSETFELNRVQRVSGHTYSHCVLNVFCSIFVPFHFYLIMTLVVPCLHNMFMVLLIFSLGNFKIGATKPIFLDSGSPRGVARGGRGGSCVRRHGLL